MSNVTDARCNGYRRKLLSSASALALAGSIYAAGTAQAAIDSEQPSVWFDLGWQYEDVIGRSDPFLPPFVAQFPAAGSRSPKAGEKTLPYSYGADAAISIRPEDTDWVLSASIRYGRAHGRKHLHEQADTKGLSFYTTGVFGVFPKSNPYLVPARAADFTDASTSNANTHLIADFQAGKDVGLGTLGQGATSVFSFGVRFAQFRSSSSVNLAVIPDFEFSRYSYVWFFHASVPRGQKWHDYSGKSQNEMDFSGIGPSISWNASVPVSGNLEAGEISFDWGANAALLFGRQKTRGQHQASGRYNGLHHTHNTQFYFYSTPHARMRRVTVPNIGGFAGLSLKWSNAKLSIGYRADYFENAIDGGVDTRKQTSQAFFGPFASISIGISPSDF